MRTTGGKGESASFLLGGRVGLILHLGRENVGPPVNFGRFRGPNGPAGGAFAPVEGREIAAAVAGGVAAADWRLWCWPHWLQPAVSPTRKGGESASSARPGKGGESASSARPGKGGKVPSLALARDQPPLATSRRCWLAAAQLCVPPSDPPAEAGGSPAVPGPAGAVLTGDRDG